MYCKSVGGHRLCGPPAVRLSQDSISGKEGRRKGGEDEEREGEKERSREAQ